MIGRQPVGFNAKNGIELATSILFQLIEIARRGENYAKAYHMTHLQLDFSNILNGLYQIRQINNDALRGIFNPPIAEKYEFQCSYGLHFNEVFDLEAISLDSAAEQFANDYHLDDGTVFYVRSERDTRAKYRCEMVRKVNLVR